MERPGGVEDGAVHLCGHHGHWAAVSSGHHLTAFSGQHCQLEGVQLHTGTSGIDTNVHKYLLVEASCKEQDFFYT